MIVFYSGFGCTISNPEVALGDKCNLMLTFADSQKRPHPRFAAVLAARERRLPVINKPVGKNRGKP